jgi:hypothetical protein
MLVPCVRALSRIVAEYDRRVEVWRESPTAKHFPGVEYPPFDFGSNELVGCIGEDLLEDMRKVNVELRAYEAFGGVEEALRWLTKPSAAFGGKTPTEHAITKDGRDQLHRILNTIARGGA